MEKHSKYKTKQREIILDYLKAMPGEHVTAGDVCEFFLSKGTSIGQATIYRQLESMVSEGIINKYTLDAGSPACFEYMGEDSHKEGTCYHCRCEKCGKLIHLHCDELESIQSHLLSEHGIQMDPIRTVLYGLCESCRRA